MSRTIRWYREVLRTDAPLEPSERVQAWLNDLREREGLWAEVSRHSSKGAGQVAAARWRKRWRGQEDGHLFRVRAEERYPGEENPVALLLSYKPKPEMETAPCFGVSS